MGFVGLKGLRVDKKQPGVYYTVRIVVPNREACWDAVQLVDGVGLREKTWCSVAS